MPFLAPTSRKHTGLHLLCIIYDSWASLSFASALRHQCPLQ